MALKKQMTPKRWRSKQAKEIVGGPHKIRHCSVMNWSWVIW